MNESTNEIPGFARAAAVPDGGRRPRLAGRGATTGTVLRRLGVLLVAGVAGTIGSVAVAQIVAPAPGPNGVGPTAPAPSSRATSPGASPAPSIDPAIPAASTAPSASATSPGAPSTPPTGRDAPLPTSPAAAAGASTTPDNDTIRPGAPPVPAPNASSPGTSAYVPAPRTTLPDETPGTRAPYVKQIQPAEARPPERVRPVVTPSNVDQVAPAAPLPATPGVPALPSNR